MTRQCKLTTIDEVVFHAALVLGSEEVLPHDRHAAAYVIDRSGDIGRGALRALPRARRGRTRGVLAALAMTPIAPPTDRRAPWPPPFSAVAFDVAVNHLERAPTELQLTVCTRVLLAFAGVVEPTSTRCGKIMRSARSAMDDAHLTRLVRVLAQWASDTYAYGALVEVAATLAGSPRLHAGVLVAALVPLRRAARRALPLRWFLAAAQAAVAEPVTASRSRVLREMLHGIVGADGREPVALRAFRAEHASFLAHAHERPFRAWRPQLVTT